MVNSNQTAFALLPISLIGSVVNWAVLYSILKLQSFNHSFGFLSANQATVDALHSTMFLLYFCPMVLLDSTAFKSISEHCGFFILLCYEISVMTHLAISLNRFCAVWTPYKYQDIFSSRNTKILICGIWIYTSLAAFLFYEVLCNFYYDDKIRFLTFTNSEFCGYIGWYGDFLKNASIVAFVMLIDLLTIMKVRKMSKKVSANISDQAQNRISAREMRFFEANCNTRYIEDKWVVFLATSFAWVAVHAVDGIVVFLFNPEIRKFLMCRKEKLPKPISITQTTLAPESR